MNIEDDTLPERTSSEILSNVLLGIILVFALRRSLITSSHTVNFIKGRLRSLGIWLTHASLISTFIFITIISFLSNKIDINRWDVEIKREFNASYSITFKQYSLDLITFMMNSLKVAPIFMISALFLAVSLCDLNPTSNRDEIKSSVCSFSKIWGILRIPLFLYFESLSTETNKETTTFFREMITASELIAISIFLVLMKIGSKNYNNEHSENINILRYSVFGYCIFRHLINLVDFPFIFSDTHKQIIHGCQIGFNLAIYIALTSIFCPIKNLDETENNKNFENTENLFNQHCDVTLMTSLIEFDEHKFKN